MNNPDNGINTNGEKSVKYHGLVFVKDAITGYYLNSWNRLRLHRYVWEENNTRIPKGYDIHHLNGDKNDNTVSNLRLVSTAEHLSLHGHNLTEKQKAYLHSEKEYAVKKATEWHKSEEGRAWHRKHIKEQWHNWHTKHFKNICEVCGKEFFATRPARLCSNACKTKARFMRGVDNETRNCVICGKGFVCNKYSRTEVCSRQCRGKLIVKRRTENKKNNLQKDLVSAST